jgi:hypothetical protein
MKVSNQAVIPGCAVLAQTRNPELEADIDMPGSMLSRRPGMTV